MQTRVLAAGKHQEQHKGKVQCTRAFLLLKQCVALFHFKWHPPQANLRSGLCLTKFLKCNQFMKASTLYSSKEEANLQKKLFANYHGLSITGINKFIIIVKALLLWFILVIFYITNIYQKTLKNENYMGG